MENDVLLALLPIDPPEGYLKRLERRFPGLCIRWHNAMPGGRNISQDELPPGIFDGVSLLCTLFHLPDPETVSDLKLVQLCSAGTDHFRGNPLFAKPGLRICSASGCHS